MNSGGAWIAIITSIIAGLAGFAALIRTFLERPKYRADAMTLVTQAATDQMKTIQDDNADVRQRLTAVEAKLATALEKLEVTEDKLEHAERQNRLLSKQNRILMAYAQASQEWCARYYAEGHASDMKPPPAVPDFSNDTLP